MCKLGCTQTSQHGGSAAFDWSNTMLRSLEVCGIWFWLRAHSVQTCFGTNYLRILATRSPLNAAQPQGERRAIAHVLDPLLRKMVHFNTASDLSARIATLYQVAPLLASLLCEGFNGCYHAPSLCGSTHFSPGMAASPHTCST